MNFDANADSLLLFVLVFAILGMLFDVVLVFRGFASLRTRRLSENLPTSTVRAMALGPVELSGIARSEREVTESRFGMFLQVASVKLLPSCRLPSLSSFG